MSTTPTGIPIIDCEVCDKTHPETREHCGNCGNPSAFITTTGVCLLCHAYGNLASAL